MTTRRIVAALSVAVVLVLFAGSGAASAVSMLQMRVELAGRVARDRAGEEPMRLEPQRRMPLVVTVTNHGSEPVRIRHVRLEGEALGLQFLTYDVSVNERVPAGARRTITVPLDLYDLGNQATGYLPAAVRLYDGKRQELAEQKFVVDVRGKGTSTLGIFAVALLVLAAISVGALVYKMFRRQLSRNRAMRGLQFMLAGAAVGLTLALGLPILRITSIHPDGWIPLALGPMAIGFAIGYLAPGPLSLSIEEAREEELLDLVASQALERLTAEQEAARRTGETILRRVPGERAPAPVTAAAGGERASGPAPATTAVPGRRSSGPAPATTAVPGRRSSGPAPATTAVPAGGQDDQPAESPVEGARPEPPAGGEDAERD